MKISRASLLSFAPLLAGLLLTAPPAFAMSGPCQALGLVRGLVAAGLLPAPGTAAQRVAIGPEGELEARVVDVPILLDQFLVNALRQDDAGLVEEHRPDGSVTIHLQGRYQSASVARLGPHGVSVTCASGHDGTTRCLHEAAPASGREER
jgi:hypothetical protein